MKALRKNGLILVIMLSSVLHLQAQRRVRLGFTSAWDFNVSLPAGTGYTALGSGDVSQLSFDGHLSIPIGFLRFTPMLSTSLPLRTMLVRNPTGANVPGGYDLDVPYTSGPDFSYYLYGDTYEWEQSEAEISQSLLGLFFSLDLGDRWNSVELGSGVVMRDKKAVIYTPLAYDEYEWYASTGTEWDHYFYADTYFEPEYKVETFRESTIMVPLMVNFVRQWGPVYTGFGAVYYTGRDPFVSFRYSMGVGF